MTPRRSRSLVALLPIASAIASLASVRCVGDDPAIEVTRPTTDDASVADSPSGTDGPVTGEDGSSTVDASLGTLDGAIALALGRTHSCAILADQSVRCWGNNDSGQLGVLPGVTAASGTPIAVDLLGKKAKLIAAGSRHTCVVTTDSAVLCWGSNDKGQLGRSTFGPANAVEAVTLPSAITKPALLAAGGAFSCIGDAQGLFLGAPGEETNAVYCFGENLSRQLSTDLNNGLPVTTPTRLEFMPVSPALPHFALALGEDFSCGGFHGSPNGSSIFRVLQCWGNNVLGQTGAPTSTTTVTRAQTIPTYNGSAAAQLVHVAAGKAHACAVIDVNGTGKQLICWGSNTKGQTGETTTGARPLTAVPSFNAGGITSLAAGGEVTCYVADGIVSCAGANDRGQLGRGTTNADVNATFAPVGGLTGPTAVAVGGSHACALLLAGAGGKSSVKCWGANDLGQLGTGAVESTPRSTPATVVASKP